MLCRKWMLVYVGVYVIREVCMCVLVCNTMASSAASADEDTDANADAERPYAHRISTRR